MTVVYDGDCGICSAAVGFGRARAPQGTVAFVPSHALGDAERRAIEARAGAGVFDRSIVFVDGDRTLTDAHALNAALAAVFPRTAPLVAIADRIAPLVALENAAYRLFSRHRRTLSRALGLNACAPR